MNWCPASYKFYKKYLKNLKHNVKKGAYNFHWYFTQLDHVHEEQGWSAFT